jgi:hypothetical protein
MSAADSRIEKYNSVTTEHLRVLALHIQQTPFELGEPSQMVILELLKKNLSEKISVTFSGVQTLRVADVHPGCLCRLNITSVVGEQLEGLCYRVYNMEQDLTLSFYCRDFELSELPV